MCTAVILLWCGCLWSITRCVLELLWTASLGRKLLVLTAALLALSSSHTPNQTDRPPA